MGLHKLLQYLVPAVLIGAAVYVPDYDPLAMTFTAVLAFVGFAHIRERYSGRILTPYIILAISLTGAIYLALSLEQALAVAFAAFWATQLNYVWNSRGLDLGDITLGEIRRRQKGLNKQLSNVSIDENYIIGEIQEFNSFDRDRLEEQGFLKKPPRKGRRVLKNKHRSSKGNELLDRAKLLLFALLYGDKDSNVMLSRIQNELLSITVNRRKAHCLLPFMKAVTEIRGKGTWIEGNSADVTTDNVILEVVYGETSSELIGNAIKSCLKLINHLEINEEVLFFRMMNIEQSNLLE